MTHISLSSGSQLAGHDLLEFVYQIACISHIYITIHKSNKLIVMKQQQNKYMSWGSPSHGKLVSSHSLRKVENILDLKEKDGSPFLKMETPRNLNSGLAGVHLGHTHFFLQNSAKGEYNVSLLLSSHCVLNKPVSVFCYRGLKTQKSSPIHNTKRVFPYIFMTNLK